MVGFRGGEAGIFTKPTKLKRDPGTLPAGGRLRLWVECFFVIRNLLNDFERGVGVYQRRCVDMYGGISVVC